jgi:hypothetical protein
VNLIGSTYGLTFIDTTRVWDIGRSHQGSVLNVVATDYSELEGVDDEGAKEKLIAELLRFIPFDRAEIVSAVIQPHVKEPLFMNDVGIWHFRPKAVPTNDAGDVEIDNLFLAGDYCRSNIDLVSMEGAFTTGLYAAKAIVERVQPGTFVEDPAPNVKISAVWWFLWLAGVPFAFVMKLISKVASWRQSSRQSTSQAPRPPAATPATGGTTTAPAETATAAYEPTKSADSQTA